MWPQQQRHWLALLLQSVLQQQQQMAALQLEQS
jgi:hypothetical protein